MSSFKDIGDDRARREMEHAIADARWAEQEGLSERAVSAYRRAAAIQPAAFEAHGKLAQLFLTLGRPAEALEAGLCALALKPADPMVNANVGLAYLGSGQVAVGVEFMTKALGLNPTLHSVRGQLADALLDSGAREAAVAVMTGVEQQFWNDPQFLMLMGDLCRRAETGPLAERAYVRLLQVAPANVRARRALAELYMDHTHFSGARTLLAGMLEVTPDDPELLHLLALTQASLGMVPDAVSTYRRALEVAPNLGQTHSNMLLTMHYSTQFKAEELAEEHRRWGRRHAPPSLACTVFPNQPEPGRSLRIGYVSPDFRRHSVAFFFESILDCQDRNSFQAVCYSDVRRPDEVTERIRSKSAAFRNISRLTDAQVVELIKADQVDILVDLAGHAGSSRTTLLGYKPAPVLVTWCGYPDTTGVECVDYRITDWFADPVGVEGRYTEHLVRLPNTFLCYRPPEVLPDCSRIADGSSDAITFGSFNRELKISAETYDLWCRILHAVPRSKMLVKSIAGGDPATRAVQLREFERRGISSDRVTPVGFVADPFGHLSKYREVDIALDTYPYCGTTTTLEALLMGVPVITLSGYTHAGLVGVSILSNVGMQELIASTAEDYVARAVALAAKPEALAAYRRSLRTRLLASPLCDAPAFTRYFEYALRGMWCNWCQSRGAGLTGREQMMADFDFSPVVGGDG